jgi:6-phosphogluconolactonase
MKSKGELHVFSDAQALARALADLFIDVGNTAMANRGNFRVALAGGETPRAAYELLAQEPRRDQISWSDVFVYFGDERCVPPTDEQSNYLMAYKAFLSSVPIPPANVHRMVGEIEPGHAANEYASVIRDDLKDPPRLDLVMLGIGPDGHTASLFPGTPPDKDDHALIRAVYSEERAQWRITMTPRLINLARTIVFGVEGAGKAEILASVLEGPRDTTRYPAQVVQPSSGRLLWYVDQDAAGLLKQKATH